MRMSEKARGILIGELHHKRRSFEMYIKQIVLEGFKSYAQRTEITGFDPLFNAITGLNGSGKSNILDAICFLLGITNLSQVRAGNLQELVYKGGQAGITRATVTITFDNSDRRQSPLGYESYEEITVSRQVVIGGRNKYLINGSNATPSRVQDLFCSVQLNVNNPHFLIMQGRVTKVLNMKPIEILSMIEEAAGTRMYESKKTSAQKTIVKKETKLHDIQTILDEEITPTIRKLKEERSSYLEYQKVTRELEHLNQLSIAWQYWQAEQVRKQSSSDLDDMNRQIEELKAKIAEADDAIAESKSTAKELEKRRSEETRGPILELEKLVDEYAKSCAVAEATLQASKDELSNDQRNRKDMQKNFEEDNSLLGSKKTELEEKEGACEDLQRRSREAEDAVQRSRDHYQAVTAGLSSGAHGNDETLAAQKIACENEISSAVTETKQAEMRLTSAQEELKGMEAGQSEEASSYSQDKATLTALQKTIDKLESAMKKLDYREGHERELRTKSDQLKSEISALKDKIHHLESRFPQSHFEYQDPTTNFDRSRVKGPVVRLLRVRERGAATALEVTAGGRLYNVVVDTEQTGKQLLQNGGLRRRYTIIPLNKISSHCIPDGTIRKAQSLVGGGDQVRAALSLVGYDQELRPAMAYVFGSTFICDTLQMAKQVTFDKQVQTRSVSLAGDVFDPSGTLTGGARSSTSSILLHLDQLCGYEQQLREKEAELREVSAQLTSVEKLAARYGELKEQREEKVHEADVVRVRMEQSSHHRQSEHLRQLRDNIARLKETVKEAKVSEKSARRRLEEIQNNMKEFSSHRDAELKAAEGEMVRVREEAAGVVREAKARRLEVDALKMEIEELEKSLNSQRQQMDASSEAISKKMSKVEENQTAETQAKEKLREARGRLDDQKKVARERNKDLQRLEAERREKEREKAGHFLAVKEVEHRVAKFHKHSRDAAAKVEALLAQYEWIATDRQYFGQPNTAYDFEANDPKEAARRVEKLQQQKDKLSKTVNMRAMNMLGKAEERYNDLLKKKDIVANDKTKIVKLIEELDQKKNTTLREAHERVNKDFGSIFSTLLPGTAAVLAPPEGQTVLEGLEVRVAFGKVWKESLQELSGGQRSLMALSLILALLLFKPAPVYILDEVDAALDLSHTQNIGQMLKSHFRSSQFIVVSLKDGMFNNANVLFKTKFVDGVSIVTRYVNPQVTRRDPSATGSHRERDTVEKKSSRKKRVRIGPVATPTSNTS